MANGVILGQTLNTNNLLPLDGSKAMTGDLNLNNHKITNVATPTNNNDVANKSYVDNNRGGNIAVLHNTTSSDSISFNFNFNPSFALISMTKQSGSTEWSGYALIENSAWNSNLMFVYQGTDRTGSEFTNVGAYSLGIYFSRTTIRIQSIPDILIGARISVMAFGQS